MSAWIKSHQSLSRHRKTIRAVAMLKVDRHKFLGHMHELWWWGLDSVPADGWLNGLSDDEIAAGAQWEGDASEFVRALTTAGFIDVDNSGERWLHGWYEYAGMLMDRRNTNAERMRNKRATTTERAGHVQDTCKACAPTREDKTREEKNTEDPGASAPVPISKATIVKGQIAEVWDYYKEHVSPLARICPESKVKTRLCTYSVADLKRAVDCFCAHWWWYTHNKGQGGEWFFRSDGQIDRFLLLVPETQEQCEARNRPSANGRQQSDPVRKSAPRVVVPASMRGGTS